jgi:hypothetical protein
LIKNTKGEHKMKNIAKVTLKKMNNIEKNHIAKVLGCHCGCEGKPVSAGGNGYVGQYL